MSFEMICSKCHQPIEGAWEKLNDRMFHEDKELCAQLEAIAKSPLIIAAGKLGKIVHEKNTAYGSSFAKCGQFLELLYPEGVKPAQYTDMLLLVRIFDKQMRIATDKDALGENPFSDIAGYGLLGVVKDA
jgi:hypothetical protein